MLRRTAVAAYRAKAAHSSLEACSACLLKQLQPGNCCSSDGSETSSSIRASLSWGSAWQSRGFASPAEADEDDAPIPSHPRVQKLAEEIMHLNLLEIADLTEILQKRLNIQTPGFGAMPLGNMPAPGGAVPEAAPAPAPAEKEPEKTEFDVKLDGFDAASKIKVIKEVRSVTELGLKEAKELVEKAPVVVKAGLKKEEAEELQKKLQAVGAKISLE